MVKFLLATREARHFLSWGHWIIIGLSFALTLVAWTISKNQVESNVSERFNKEADQIVSLITERLQKYEDALWAGVAYVQTHGEIPSYTQWKKYAENLHIGDKYPGINGIGFIKHLEPEEVDLYLNAARKERPDFNIHPKHDNNEFWPIVYIEPEQINAAAVGLDMAHEINRLTASKLARDTKSAQITAPITLVQDSAQTPGFLFFTPVFKKPADEFTGLVYAPFIVKKLMLGTLAQSRRHVSVHIEDDGQVIFSEKNDNPDYDHNAIHQKNFKVSLYGRMWDIKIQSSKSFQSLSSYAQPTIILVCGVIIELLLAAVFWLLVNAKIRAQKEAHRIAHQYVESEKRTTAILNSTTDVIITLSPEGNILNCNRALESSFQYKIKSVTGTNISCIVPELHNIEKFISKHDTTQSEDIHYVRQSAFEVTGTRRDGSSFPIEMTINHVETEGDGVFCAVLKDVTERKHLDKMKNEFISTISHEIRTPLTSVKGAVGLLTKSSVYKDDLCRKMLDIMQQNLTRLASLIDDILHIEKMASGKMTYNMEYINSSDLLSQIVQRNQSLETSYNVNFILKVEDDAAVIEADIFRLEQAVVNLLLNAAKFAWKGSDIIIGQTSNQNEVMISLMNQGEGIPYECQKNIFQAFYQADSTSTRSQEGTGLGLYITKQIIESFNGHIHFESTPHASTCFTITLPRAIPLRKAG